MRRILSILIRRELNARLFSRTFLVTLLVTVALIFAIFGIQSLFGDDALNLGLVGDQPVGAVETLAVLAEAAETPIETQVVASRAEAEALLESGELDGAVIGGELVMDRLVEPIVALVTPAWQQAGLVASLGEAGLDGADIAATLQGAAPLELVELNQDPEADARQAVALAAVVLMFIAIQLAGGYIMLGVFEEKTTKVVELVLSSVPARYLLAGKVIGIAVLGVVQIAVLAISAVVAASIFSSSALPALSATLLLTAVVWFLLGYVLYGATFAAGASLAPRQEDAQSTLAPVTMIMILSYLAVIAAAGNPGGTLAKVLSWVPFTAPFAMPGQIAVGEVAWWEVVGSMALTAVAAVSVVLLAERIYVRSIIHTERRLGWRAAWSMQS